MLTDILFDIKRLGIYSSGEWREYLGYFKSGEEIESAIEERLGQEGLSDEKNTILETIRKGVGSAAEYVDFSISPKVVTAEHVSDLRVKDDFTLGIVSGAYDLLHPGHIRVMAYAKQFLEQYPNPRLCALTLSDKNIRIKKGESRPLLDINRRLEMICGIECIDYVIPLEHPDCLSALRRVKPDYFFKTRADNAQGIVKQEIDLVSSYGGSVIIFPARGGSISTTGLIQRVLNS